MRRFKITGLPLIILGAIICAGDVSITAISLYKRYLEFADHGYYDSFLQYFWEVGKTALLGAVLIGGILVAIGIFQLKRK